jgi:hypothetical protein
MVLFDLVQLLSNPLLGRKITLLTGGWVVLVAICVETSLQISLHTSLLTSDRQADSQNSLSTG